VAVSAHCAVAGLSWHGAQPVTVFANPAGWRQPAEAGDDG